MNLRRHMWRSVLRVCALLVTDVGAFLLLRTALRGLRGWTALGSAEIQFIRWLFADGYLGGWQYAVALIVSLVLAGSYGPGDNRRSVRRLLIACALATALPLWARLWSDPFVLTAGRYVLTVLPAWVVLSSMRLLFDHLIADVAPNPEAAAVARAILVGRAPDCLELRGRRALVGGGFHVLGWVDLQTPAVKGARGSIVNLEQVLIDERADTIILCGTVDDDTVVRVMRAAMAAECQVLTVARRFELAGVRPTVTWRRGQPFIELRPVALRGQQIILKRLTDIVLAGALIVITAPIMLLLAIAVRLESPGPVLFRQMRPGRWGQRFGMLKFRSMYRNAEAVLRADPKLYEMFLANACKLPADVDPRITKAGRFMRRTSLDELPQLWNVLKGEMSLVGPRPVVGPEIEEYGDTAPVLLSVRPGLTGLWQVSGRSTLQYPERAILDVEYVERWSFTRDLQIMLRTIPAVLRGHGAH
jgi:exopolysaccharide biosynthesis polyprenyl glycosylphosphotransferase